MAKKKTKVGTGKLSRSEIIQARLSPKLRFAADLLARRKRRSLSSLIEIIVEEYVKGSTVFTINDGKKNFMDVIDGIWHMDEPKRLVALALSLPELLSHDEFVLWKQISRCGHYWQCYQVIFCDKHDNEIMSRWVPVISLETLIERNLKDCWDILTGEEEGVLPPDNLFGEMLCDNNEPVIVKEQINVDVTKLNKNERAHWLHELWYEHSEPEEENADPLTTVSEEEKQKLVEDILRRRSHGTKIPETNKK